MPHWEMDSNPSSDVRNSTVVVEDHQAEAKRKELWMGPAVFNASTEFILVGLSNDREAQIILFVVILLFYIFTLVGNLGIIVLVRMHSPLHTPMYFFLSNLSVVEICYVTSTEPQMLAHLLTGHAELSLIHCALQMYSAMSLGATEAFLLGIMAYDRYLAICHPLVYATVMGRRRQFLLASACWVVGFSGSTACVSSMFSHPFCGPCCVNDFMCEMPMVLKLACDDIRMTEMVIFLFSVSGILTPWLVILISYGLILFSVFQMRSASALRKAFSTCGSHLAVVILFYGTMMFIYIVPPSLRSPDTDKQIAVFYVVVTPLLNPIIYTLRNKEVHAAMAKVLRRLGFSKKC